MGVANRKLRRYFMKKELDEFLKQYNLSHGEVRRAVGRLAKPTLENKLLATIGGKFK